MRDGPGDFKYYYFRVICDEETPGEFVMVRMVRALKERPDAWEDLDARLHWVDMTHRLTKEGASPLLTKPTMMSCLYPDFSPWMAQEIVARPKERIWIRNLVDPVHGGGLREHKFGFTHLPTAVHFKLRWF